MNNLLTPDYKQIFRTSFAARLIKKLRENGFISRRGVNGVNGKHLAAGIGVSMPMARRYINAQSIPENSTLQKIANWLNVEPTWLLYGDDNAILSSLQKKDVELFKEIFLQLFPLLCDANVTKEKYMFFIDGCLEIYQNISKLDHNTQQHRAITLMIDFLKKNASLTS